MTRSRLETIQAILTICVEGCKKTHIMYRANLSHPRLEKFLDVLIDLDLLSKNVDSYVTTSRGREFIEEFKKIQSLMSKKDRIAHTVSI